VNCFLPITCGGSFFLLILLTSVWNLTSELSEDTRGLCAEELLILETADQ
jgi:hypothetical protein